VLVLLARAVIRARIAVVVAFAILVPIAALFGAGVLRELQPGGFRDPHAESSIVADVTRRFVAGDLVVLYSLPPGSSAGTVDDVEAYATLADALTRAEAHPDVVRVASFVSTGAPWLVSRDRTRTVALATLKGTDTDKVAAIARLRPAFAAEGYQVQFGGYAPVFAGITSTVELDLRRAELVALPLTLLLLLVLFRSVVSAAIPVILGGSAIAFSLAILRALHAVSDVTIFAANVATILGLGLAIDYSLFVLMRFREELPKVGERRAILRAMATAGRAVAFSGTTVAVSLCGLFVFPHGVLRSVAVGGIAVTLATVVLSLTLLPALLALAGKRVDALRLPFGMPPPSDRMSLPPSVPDAPDPWHRLAAVVMHRPVLTGVAVIMLLLVLAVPFVRLAPSIADARALPRGDEARTAQEIVDREFGCGTLDQDCHAHLTTPHDVVVHLDEGAWTHERLMELDGFAKRMRAIPGVSYVTGPLSIAPGDAARAATLLLADTTSSLAVRSLFLDKDTARFAVLSDFAVDDARALEQVELLRRVAPPTGTHALVGGQAAWIVDVRHALHVHTPAMIAFIALAMTVVLFLVFGSLVLPLKAIAMNLLSLTASFGAIVWVFQDGRLTSLFAFEPLGTTEASVPVLMFAIVFGLSMDYEVLLLSRIREEYLATGDNSRAVARGLARTGRLITSAALLLVVVVLCFATSRLVLIKTLAVGIAVAVFLDATVVRSLLVPATMRLLGDWNWWAPNTLARLWERVGGPRRE
jgi:RND superfamily putative drug exporter